MKKPRIARNSTSLPADFLRLADQEAARLGRSRSCLIADARRSGADTRGAAPARGGTGAARARRPSRPSSRPGGGVRHLRGLLAMEEMSAGVTPAPRPTWIFSLPPMWTTPGGCSRRRGRWATVSRGSGCPRRPSASPSPSWAMTRPRTSSPWPGVSGTRMRSRGAPHRGHRSPGGDPAAQAVAAGYPPGQSPNRSAATPAPGEASRTSNVPRWSGGPGTTPSGCSNHSTMCPPAKYEARCALARTTPAGAGGLSWPSLRVAWVLAPNGQRLTGVSCNVPPLLHILQIRSPRRA